MGMLPNDVWAAICQAWRFLCVPCMDELAAKAGFHGVHVNLKFRGKALIG
jgi:hypothetical protein